MTGYSVNILETSKELKAREKIAIKDTSNAKPLDEIVAVGFPVRIKPDWYAVLEIHNEKSEDKDYKKYVIVDKDGEKYVTGSESFFTSFRDIFTDMIGEEEDYEIECYKMESKNYKGKHFLTCSIVF